MASYIIELTLKSGKWQAAEKMFIREPEKLPVSFALAEVSALLGLYNIGFIQNGENGTGFRPIKFKEEAMFCDLIQAFGHEKNAVKTRTGEIYRIANVKTIEVQEAMRLERKWQKENDTSLVSPDDVIEDLFHFIKHCIAKGHDTLSACIMECNEPMYKAIAIIRDLINEGYEVWDSEVSKKFIERFYSK